MPRLVAKILFSHTLPIQERSVVRFSYSDPVICPLTTFPSSTNHQHCSITIVPVAPEANLLCLLKWSIACSLPESIGCLKLAAILNTAISLTVITCPNSTISKVTITGDFRPECLSTQTVPCGLQQRGVLRVITARDLEFQTTDQPLRWREHVCIHWCVYFISNACLLIVPPPSTTFHPIFGIIVWEATNKSPSLARTCHITISLKK